MEALYRAAGWWQEGDNDDALRRLVAGSWMAAGAFDGERLVGMARVLSDGASDAYIQDVVVLPEARRRGVASALVAFCRDACEAAGIGWIGLIAQPGTVPFYERLGFRAMPGHVPMLRHTTPGAER
jgi:ribosomal protein S18 acetylase RimI-like enzyme